MTDQSNYLKRVILEAESLELENSSLANRYVNVLKNARSLLMAQMEKAQNYVKIIEEEGKRLEKQFKENKDKMGEVK
jgi:hypothetical protein